MGRTAVLLLPLHAPRCVGALLRRVARLRLLLEHGQDVVRCCHRMLLRYHRLRRQHRLLRRGLQQGGGRAGGKRQGPQVWRLCRMLPHLQLGHTTCSVTMLRSVAQRSAARHSASQRSASHTHIVRLYSTGQRTSAACISDQCRWISCSMNASMFLASSMKTAERGDVAGEHGWHTDRSMLYACGTAVALRLGGSHLNELCSTRAQETQSS